MKEFEMPEKYVCSCTEGRTYDKESEVCKKCVRSSMALKILFQKVVDEGSPEMIATLLISMAAAKVEKEKDKKEEDFKNE